MYQILIVEDDRGLNQGIALALRQEGVSFLQAYNAAEGRDFWEKGHVDMALLDVNLPDRMLERNKGFFFLSEKSQKTGTFPFLRFFARTFPSYDRHLLCYLFLYLFLFIEYLHDSIQQFFFFSQQLAYAVYTLAAAGSGLIYTSCTSLRRLLIL